MLHGDLPVVTANQVPLQKKKKRSALTHLQSETKLSTHKKVERWWYFSAGKVDER